MKIRHRIPVDQIMRSDPVTPEYQAEVDRSTAAGEAAYRRAEQRLAAAQRRRDKAARAPVTRKTRRHLAELDALVELRRQELDRLHCLMVTHDRPSTNQGRRSHRHVPSPRAF